MFTWPGYSVLETVSETENSVVARARRSSDGAAVYIKTLPEGLPPPDKLTRLRREFRMTEAFQDERVIRVFGLEQASMRLGIILEDFGGLSLDRCLDGPREDITTLLRVAIAAVDALQCVHARMIIHKDVAPSNFVWERASGRLKIIDFGISTALSRERPRSMNPAVVEGTLAFMSPEQTGRMNRALDYRSDFYSLGATLYWLFTGAPPFRSSDALELAHCHLARLPNSPRELNQAIPEALAGIVLKLLAKNAEDRYQSAGGLRFDLQRCLDELLKSGVVVDFPLASKDFSQRFLIPERLYGREAEIRQLLGDAERVFAGGKAMTLVAGYSGIGKSALVQEIHKPIAGRRGYFAGGKFDQFKRNIPFASLTQALQGLIRQLLSESEEALLSWREKIQKAVGVNGQIILDVIPEVGLVLGSQPPVARLGALESQNRFNMVLGDFIRVFAAPDHPLTLFLDDLQWADSPSLSLIERLMTDAETQSLFLVGAYRDNEVSASHPLMLSLRGMEEAGAELSTITLSPLTAADTAQLVADSLGCGADEVEELTEICLAKTQGNPFFLRQFLRAVYERGGLEFDQERAAWSWSGAVFKAGEITDNVVELMAEKIQSLSDGCQEQLQFAACIGAVFDLSTLAIVREHSPQEVAEELWPAVQEGFVVPLGGDYKFLQEHSGGRLGSPAAVRYRWLHDRVQQAAYALISEDRKESVHHLLGERMLSKLSPEERDEKLFEIVGHLNRGASLRVTQSERDELAELNLELGRKAIASVAFEAAKDALERGLDLLGPEPWERRYELCLELHTEAARASHLIPDFAATERLFRVIKKQARRPIERVRSCEFWATVCQAQNRIPQGLDESFEVLRALGYSIPESPGEEDIARSLELAAEAIGGRSFEELAALPPNPDATEVAAIRLMMIMAPLAYIVTPALFPILALEAVTLSVRNGDSGASSFAYVLYGTLLSGVMGDFERAVGFGELGQRVLIKHDAREYAARVAYVPSCFLVFWTKHLREAWGRHPESYRLGLENGDQEFAIWSLVKRCQQGFFLGMALSELVAETRDCVAACRRLGQTTSMSYAQATLQAMRGLMGDSKHPCELIGEDFDELQARPRYVEASEAFGLCNLHLTKAMLFYLWDRWEEGLVQEGLAEPWAAGMLSLFHVPLFDFYLCLCRLALAQQSEDSPCPKRLAAADESIARMAGWAERCPENFLHKLRLMEGERALLSGDFETAERCFLEGIAGAEAEGYVQEQALGYELLGRSWILRGDPTRAGEALARARHVFAVWGASAKVAQLDAKYPELLATGTRSHSSTTTQLGDIDISTVLKWTQAISSEVKRESLLRRLLNILMENAGARTGVLILEQDGEAIVEARGSAGGEVELLEAIPLASYKELPQSVVQLVRRSHQSVIVDDLREDLRFTQDPYIELRAPRSLLCLPVEHQGKLVASLYLENDLTPAAFTASHVSLLTMLLGQVAISLENARLYGGLEDLVESRTRELAEAQERLAASLTKGKLKAEGESKAKSLFLAAMNHEIRTPLNAIIGLSALCAQRELTPDVRRYLTKIETSSKLLLGLVQSVLELSKIEAGKLELATGEIPIGELFGQLSDLVSDAARGQGLGFELRLDPELPPVLIGDGVRLGQVLTNLLNNALKFTQSGEIRLEARLLDRLEDRVRVRFSVRDTGIGIAPEAQNRLFEPFTQVDESTTREYGGVGLGLAICKLLVELMGDDLKLKSELGRGSEFFFELELAVGTRAERPVLESQAPLPELRGVRVLVAEDAELNRLVAQRLLESAGLEVRLVCNGLEAIAALGEAPVDALLLDVHMPEMDGYEAARAIRQLPEFEDLPIIAMTADAMREARDRCLAAGMNAFLTKPIDLSVMLSTLARCLGERAAQPREHRPVETAARDQELPRIPGLKMAEALKRFGGDLPTLLGVLKRLPENYRASELSELWRSGDWEAVGRSLHRLKGMAGNIAALRLHGLVVAVEEGLLRSARREDSLESLGRLEAALAELLSSCAALSSGAQGGEPTPRSRQLSEPGQRTVAGELEELSELLERNSFGAKARIRALRQRLNPDDALALEILAGAIERLDYKAAKEILKKLSL